MDKPIYLDYNATTPTDPRVAEAMLPYLREEYGNPSSSHAYGIATKKAVERARQQVASLLGCRIDELIFTSGGSESNNYAIIGAALASRARGNHIITSAIEHPAVTEVCRHLEGQGFTVTYLPVDGQGLVDPAAVEAAITPRTVLVTIMHANNEVGTVEPIREIAELARRRDVLVHSDCAQSVGKIPVRVDELGVDLLSVAGHKLYAPKGIGTLYVRTGVRMEKLIHGADHEMNRRAGTENVLEIVGLGEACAIVEKELEEETSRLRALRDRLEAGLKERVPHVRVNGHPTHRLPNTLSVSFKGLEANTILSELTTVAASAGAACHSDQVDVSPTLAAMGVPVEYAMGTIRLSAGRFTTEEEIDRALTDIVNVVNRLGAAETAVAAEGPIKLTQFTHGLGCACKLRPQLLEQVLKDVPVPRNEKVLVATDTADDAAVYWIDAQTAVVQTIDFFTPIVDDPYQFGAIAAANSLSDIYAMGASPIFALNVVGFPSNRLPLSVLESILKGARDKAEEAHVSILGGHTVDDTEPKYGMAVTGLVHPERVITNRGARPGDVLYLTKPLGTGILSTALKRGLLEAEQAERLTATMATLNKGAAEAMQAAGVHAATDVTGFGLIGHLLEMLRGSQVSATIHAEVVPLLPGVTELALSGVIPGGTRDNMDFTAPSVTYDQTVSETTRLLLNDAQTSGGLLIAVAPDRAAALEEHLAAKGVLAAARIGAITEGPEARATVTG
jgi:cysteine desulfurase NifS/selenium donor protein